MSGCVHSQHVATAKKTSRAIRGGDVRCPHCAKNMAPERSTDDPDGNIERELEQKLELAERRVKALRAALIAFRGANPPVEPPLVSPESRQFIRKSGKPWRPIEAILKLLRDRNGEMPTDELYGKMVEGGAFRNKAKPESAFRLSIKINIDKKKIAQTDSDGRNIKDIDDVERPFPGVTTRASTGDVRQAGAAMAT
jgi:hypothetical protein